MKPTFLLLTFIILILVVCTSLLYLHIVPFGLQYLILVLISLPWTNVVSMKFRINMSFFNLVVFVLMLF